MPPPHWAHMNRMALSGEMCLAMVAPTVIAGLVWQPETLPKQAVSIAMANPAARAELVRSVCSVEEVETERTIIT